MKYLINIQWIAILTISLFLTACSDTGSSGQPQSRSKNNEYAASELEGDSGVTPVSLSFTANESQVITYETFNISAAEKSDYQAISDTIEVLSGKTYTLDFEIFADEEIEGSESFGVRFKTSNNEIIEEKRIQILNDDIPRVTVNKPEVSESDVGTTRLVFDFTLEDSVVDDYSLFLSTVSVDQLSQADLLAYKYIAMPEVDYRLATDTIVFSRGDIKKTVEVEVLSENIIEENELVLLRLTDVDDINVLGEGVFVEGTIRSDETPSRNGFDIESSDDASALSIQEGPNQEENLDTWKRHRLNFKIENNSEIHQTQNISLRLKSKSEYLESSSQSTVNYVNQVVGGIDVCMEEPDTKPSETTECKMQTWKELNVGDETISFDIFIQQDKLRESLEQMSLSVENDQGVVFTDVLVSIVNDDQEELLIKRPDTNEIVSLKDFNEALVLTEPTSEEGLVEHSFEVSLSEDISGDYELGYEVASVGFAGGADFESKRGSISFSSTKNKDYISFKLYADGLYDGDKDLVIRFYEQGISPIDIRVLDIDRPKVQIKSIDVSKDKEGIFIVSEQPNTTYGTDGFLVEDQVYDFELTLVGAVLAYNDLVYEIEEVTSVINETEETACQPLDLIGPNTLANASNEDFTLIVGEKENVESITILQDTDKASFSIKIHDDTDIECIERFNIKITPEGSPQSEASSASETLALAIPNKDGAKFEVQGFSVDEDAGTANVKIIGSHPVVADFNLTPDYGVHACSRLDINEPNDGFASSVSADGLTTEISVGMASDDLVEPDEDCAFTVDIAGIQGEPRFKYAFANANGEILDSNDEPFTSAQAIGTIKNDDFLTFEIAALDSDEIEAGSTFPEDGIDVEGTQSNNFIEVKWDKPIAENARDLIGLDLTLDASACDDTASGISACAADGDFENSTINATFTHTHFAVQESDDGFYRGIVQDLAIENDSVFELMEAAFFNISLDANRQDSAKYIKKNAQDELLFTRQISLNIIDNDGPEIEIIRELNECFEDETVPSDQRDIERDCKQIYSFRKGVDKDIASNINIGVVVDFGGSASVKQSNSDTDYGDVSVCLAAKNETTCDNTSLLSFSSNNEELAVVTSGTVTDKVLIFEFVDDDVVEVDEDATISFRKAVDSISSSVSLTGITSESFTFKNDDFLSIEFTATELFEGTLPEQGVAKPFSYELSKVVAPEVPDIQLAVNIGGCTSPNTVNCAETNDYDNTTGDYLLVHDQSQGEYTPAESHSIKITYVKDALVEEDETLNIVVSKDSSHTLVTGSSYLVDFTENELPSQTQTVSAIIQNDDELTLSIVEKMSSSSCSGIIGEGSCKEYSVSWSEQIASDVTSGKILLDVVNTGPDNNSVINQNEVSNIDGSLVTVSPQDYQVSGSSVLAGKNTLDLKVLGGLIAQNKYGFDFSINVLGDGYVEPEETLSLTFADNSSYIKQVSCAFDQSCNVSSTIQVNDVLNILFGGQRQGKEPTSDLADTHIRRFPVEVTFAGPTKIASNAGSLLLSATSVCDPSRHTCAQADDFDLSNRLDISGILVSNSYDLGSYKWYPLEIEEDNDIEFPERVDIQFSESSNLVNLNGSSANSSINEAYTIENDDTATLTLSDTNAESLREGESIRIEFSVDKMPASNGPSVTIDYQLGSDMFEEPDGSFNLRPQQEDYVLSLTAKDNNVIEESQNTRVSFGAASDSAGYIENSNDLVEYVEVINNDFITLSTSLSQDGSDILNEANAVNLEWNYDQGDVLTGEVVLPVVIAFASSEDFEDVDGNVTIPANIDGQGSYSGSQVGFSVKDDSIIELDENHEVTLSLSDSGTISFSEFVVFDNNKEIYNFAINDDDDINVEVQGVWDMPNSSSKDITANFCMPSSDHALESIINYTLEVKNDAADLDSRQDELDGSSAFSLSVPLIDKAGYDNSYKNAECSIDYSVPNITCPSAGQLSKPISIAPSDFDASGCAVKTLFIANAFNETQPTKHIQYELSAGDERGISITDQQMAIANTDYPLITDTGLKSCLDGTRDVVSCYPGNMGPSNDYRKRQDARATETYPKLSYTGIDANGDPALARMKRDSYFGAVDIVYGEPEENPELCFQDNNTGRIWMKTQYSENDAIKYDYASDPLGLVTDQYCGIDKAEWAVPSVQELYSVMSMHHLTLKEGIPRQTMRKSTAYQSDEVIRKVYSDGKTSEFTRVFKSAYWSSDACQVDNVSGFWTVDFFTGVTRCESATELNFKVLVHRPQ
ncbi:DUF1566 domain-containing protein [Bermanella marisrubri]|uniref:Calx-beta domain-containing protein n=1 Tax=Bermanella marisrubri TaxID=207949 RepID=Q1N505_9GAMM|nr:Calx-beta domain-containing protein [Bermanella marisrubri]EAT13273.1 hypothetical protein RED65_00895 [Oceanobacter sp. RED65] [Bermanella marisrubri]QIZ84040.1 DUF1566 domain-containing protein [Bermanella marisrubri]